MEAWEESNKTFDDANQLEMKMQNLGFRDNSVHLIKKYALLKQ